MILWFYTLSYISTFIYVMILTSVHKLFFTYFYYIILYKMADQVFMLLLVFVLFMLLIQLEVGFVFRNNFKMILQKFVCDQLNACWNTLISLPQSVGQIFNAHSTHWQSFVQGFEPSSQFFFISNSYRTTKQYLETTKKQKYKQSSDQRAKKCIEKLHIHRFTPYVYSLVMFS